MLLSAATLIAENIIPQMGRVITVNMHAVSGKKLTIDPRFLGEEKQKDAFLDT